MENELNTTCSDVKITITRKMLIDEGACQDGIALFDALGLDGVPIEWTQTAQLGVLMTNPDYYGWACDIGLLPKFDLRYADLRGADLSNADLRYADLRGANLRGANLFGADLSEADLSEADLRYADLRGADLRGADLRGADLSNADLRYADLRGAKQGFDQDQQHLERAITLERAYEIIGENVEDGHTWWRLVDDDDWQYDDLDEFVEQLLDNAWTYTNQTLEPNPLPDMLELVVGQRPTFNVNDQLRGLYEDYDGFERLSFDDELVRAAQAAVDAAAASSSFFGEGATYYVDIRPMHADAIAKFLEGC